MSFKNQGRSRSPPSDEISIFVRPLSVALTPLEEYRLIQIAQGSDHKNANEALATLLRAHSGLVYRLALLCRTQFYKSSLQLHDFVQSGFIGLIKSVRSFDISTGNRLTTYAWPSVLRTMLRELRETGFLIRIKGRELGDKKIKPLAKAVTLASSELSLQQTVPGTDDLTFEDTIGDGEDGLQKTHRILMREILTAIINRCTFSESELFILEHRLLSRLPLTLRQCGSILHMNNQNVSLIEKRLLLKMNRAARRLGLRKFPSSLMDL